MDYRCRPNGKRVILNRHFWVDVRGFVYGYRHWTALSFDIRTAMFGHVR